MTKIIYVSIYVFSIIALIINYITLFVQKMHACCVWNLSRYDIKPKVMPELCLFYICLSFSLINSFLNKLYFFILPFKKTFYLHIFPHAKLKVAIKKGYNVAIEL